MADNEKRRKQYTAIQRVLYALLAVSLTLLGALGIYAVALGFSDYAEQKHLEQEAADSVVYANENAGVGRDQTQQLLRPGIREEAEEKDSEEEQQILAVDETYVEAFGKMLPTISEDTEIHSTCAILLDRETGQVIFSRDPDRSTYPASLTKIMTAVLGLEIPSGTNFAVTINEKMLEGLAEANASVVGFSLGEEVQYIDLLHGLMLPSGADAANAIAIACAGSTDAFVKRMNEKAEELGMLSTNFTNVHGLHDVKMRTTAADMAKLFDYALNNDTFRSIVGKRYYCTDATNIHPEGITFYSTLFSMLETRELENGAVIRGGKTGTTTPAGQCLASYCELEEREFILVTLGAFGYEQEDHFNAEDAVTLYSLIKLQ